MAFRLLSVTQIVRTDRPPRPAAQTKCYVSKIIILAERYKRIVNQTQPSSTIYRLLSSPALGRCCRLPSCPVRPGISTPSAVTPGPTGHLDAVCCHARRARASRRRLLSRPARPGISQLRCGVGWDSSVVLRHGGGLVLRVASRGRDSPVVLRRGGGREKDGGAAWCLSRPDFGGIRCFLDAKRMA